MEEYGGNIIVEAGLNAENFDAGAAKLENRMKKAAQNVAKAERNIDNLRKKLERLESAKIPTEEYAQMSASVASAEKRLTQLTRRQDEMKAVGTSENSKAWQRVQNEIDRTVKKLENYDAAMQRMEASGTAYTQDSAAIEQTRQKIDEAATTLERYQIEQREAAQAVSEYNAKVGQTSDILQTVSDRMEKFRKRVIGLAKRVFIFTMITKALRAMRSALMSTIGADAQMSNSLAQIRGNLITAFAPIYNFVVPAIRTLLSWIAKLTSAVAVFVNGLFGKTAAQASESAKALYDQAHATAAAGGAAEKAEKQLASFDTINKLSSNANSGGGGGGGAGEMPQFDTSTAGEFEDILNWVKLIGAALLAWKLSDSFLGGIKTFFGLIIAINGAIELAKGVWDAWQNGVDWDNFLQILFGAAELVAGLWIAFGPVGAAIGVVVSGLALLVAGFHDAMENGWNLQNTLMTIGGLLLSGLGIGVLTGSFIPLLIAGIAAVLLAVTVATGHGEELIGGLKEAFSGFVEFLTGVFSGDLEKAFGGIRKIFDGLGKVISSIIDGIRDAFLSLLDFIDEKTDGKLRPAIELIKSLVTWLFDTIKAIVSGAIGEVKDILSNLIKFVTGVFTNDWKMAWEGISSILKNILNGIASIFEGIINLIITGLNWLIRQANKIHFDVPDWVPGFGGKTLGVHIPEISYASLPRLAKGAVIPGGRAFLSVLGDQPVGQTNIETPLETMIDAFRKAGAGKQTIIIKIGDTEFKRFVYDAYNSEARRIGKSYA